MSKIAEAEYPKFELSEEQICELICNLGDNPKTREFISRSADTIHFHRKIILFNQDAGRSNTNTKQTLEKIKTHSKQIRKLIKNVSADFGTQVSDSTFDSFLFFGFEGSRNIRSPSTTPLNTSIGANTVKALTELENACNYMLYDQGIHENSGSGDKKKNFEHNLLETLVEKIVQLYTWVYMQYPGMSENGPFMRFLTTILKWAALDEYDLYTKFKKALKTVKKQTLEMVDGYERDKLLSHQTCAHPRKPRKSNNNTARK